MRSAPLVVALNLFSFFLSLSFPLGVQLAVSLFFFASVARFCASISVVARKIYRERKETIRARSGEIIKRVYGTRRVFFKNTSRQRAHTVWQVSDSRKYRRSVIIII